MQQLPPCAVALWRQLPVCSGCVALSPLGGLVVVCAWVCHFSDRLSRIADRTVGDFSHGALSRARLARVLVCVRSAADAKLGVGPPSILAEAPDASAMGVVLDLLAPHGRDLVKDFSLLFLV